MVRAKRIAQSGSSSLDIEREIRRLYYPGSVLALATQQRRAKRIAKYVFSGSPEEQVKKFRMIVLKLGRHWYRKQDTELWAEVITLGAFRDFVDYMLRYERLPVFLHVYYESTVSVGLTLDQGAPDLQEERGRLIADRIKEAHEVNFPEMDGSETNRLLAELLGRSADQISDTWGPLEMAIMALFTQTLDFYCGESPNRSIKLGLFLCERFAVVQQNNAQDLDSLPAQMLGACAAQSFLLERANDSPHLPGDSSSLNFMSRLLVESADNPAAHDVLQSLTEVMERYASQELVWKVEAPPEEEASGFFDELDSPSDPLTSLHGGRAEEVDRVYDREEETASFVSHMLESDSGRSVLFLMLNPVIHIRPEHEEVATLFSADLRRRFDEEAEASDRVLDWLQTNRTLLESRMEEMRADICANPRRGIRPGGADHVDIHVAPLRYAGIRSIIMYPDGHDFPDLSVHMVIRKATPHLLTYTGSTMRGLHLIPDPLYRFRDEDFQQDIDFLLEYVILDVAHRLITAATPLVSQRRGRKGKKGKSSNRSVPVRGHTKRLPEGYRASQEARLLFQKAFGWLTMPEGVTFCPAYLRGKQLHWVLPSEPAVTYQEKDLFSLGGSHG